MMEAPAPSAADMQDQDLYIADEGEQIVVRGDALRIGIGNLRPEQDADQVDGLRPIASTALWIHVRDQADLNRTTRVREEDTLDIAGHHIRVVEVDAEDGYVLLHITRPSA